ncbi:C-type lectin domain family 4 member E-like [Archocentrus centrarchus]|uniref:C-type lectin domain family 4 member E-like n=1 Tax=Archocentrus centrarchus TaxID=63155 RepID=UPI0011E9FE01|nr:C-type lectin domain family 4 member E-like [Archocentrus centrarchus]
MEQRENYSSLHEFTEEPGPGGNSLIPEHSNGSQGLKRGVECLRSKTSLLILIGFLASLFANIVLAVLLINRPGASPDTSSSSVLGLKSMQKRYIQLCEDYSALGQSCSKTVKQCRECPEGWLHVGNLCYYFSNDKLDWMKSRDSCEKMGSHLTILHTKEQHDALEKEARRIGGFDYHFWIGLSDSEKEGDWRWVDNTTLEYKYWDQLSSEPDNHHTGGEHGEDCATLDSHSKTWFDVPCDHIYKRICQMDAIQLN